MPPHSQTQKFTLRVGVFPHAGDVPLYHVHREEARRMVRDGQAVRRGGGKSCHEIALASSTASLPKSPCSPASIRDFTGRPSTYRERLLETTEEGLVTVGVVIQLKRIKSRDWPVYRAALIDCLPASAQSELREIFA